MSCLYIYIYLLKFFLNVIKHIVNPTNTKGVREETKKKVLHENFLKKVTKIYLPARCVLLEVHTKTLIPVGFLPENDLLSSG